MDYKYIIVTDLLFKDKLKDTYLFCKKENDRYYQLPGGHLTAEKGIYDSIIFYVKNQLNITLKKEDLTIRHIMEYPEKNKLYLTIEALYNNEKIDLTKSNHYKEYKWFKNDDSLIIDDKLKQVMKNILDKNLYSRYNKKGGFDMNDAILRQESFGGTYFCFNTNQRYYLTKEETENILERGIYPKDLKEADCVAKEKIKYIPMLKNEKPAKFTFSDVVFIEVTRECNLRCKHCLNDSGIKMKDELTAAETKKLIKNLAKAGIHEIRFTGGEPLLNKHIYEYIKLCTDLGLSTSIGSNGTLIDDEVIKKLKEAGLKRSVISLDGTEKIHDVIRGEGNFKKALNGIRLLKENGIDLRVNSVIMKNNIDDVIELAKFLDSQKIKLYIRRFIESGRGANLTNNSLTTEDYEYVKKELQDVLKNGYVDGHYLKGSDAVKKFRIDLPFVVTGCRAGQRSFCITPNGDIYPCGFLAAQGYNKVGNVRKVEDWRKFWNSLQKNKKLNCLREDLAKLNDKKITCMAYLYSMQEQ